MNGDSGFDRADQNRKVHRDEFLAIACGVALALLAVTAVIVYLWFR